MLKKFLIITTILSFALLTSACGNEPKVLEQDKQSAEIKTNFARNDSTQPTADSSTTTNVAKPNTN